MGRSYVTVKKCVRGPQHLCHTCCCSQATIAAMDATLRVERQPLAALNPSALNR